MCREVERRRERQYVLLVVVCGRVREKGKASEREKLARERMGEMKFKIEMIKKSAASRVLFLQFSATM